MARVRYNIFRNFYFPPLVIFVSQTFSSIFVKAIFLSEYWNKRRTFNIGMCVFSLLRWNKMILNTAFRNSITQLTLMSKVPSFCSLRSQVRRFLRSKTEKSAIIFVCCQPFRHLFSIPQFVEFEAVKNSLAKKKVSHKIVPISVCINVLML